MLSLGASGKTPRPSGRKYRPHPLSRQKTKTKKEKGNDLLERHLPLHKTEKEEDKDYDKFKRGRRWSEDSVRTT